MKRLLILRHAKSSWADSSMDDWERPLNDRGRRDAPRVGEWLRSRGVMPDAIITSDAVRARATADAAAEALGFEGQITAEPSLYLAPADAIVDAIAAAPEQAGTVMIVGHNPGLENAVSALSGETHAMPTACLIEMTLPIAHWRELDASVDATIVEIWEPHGAA